MEELWQDSPPRLFGRPPASQSAYPSCSSCSSQPIPSSGLDIKRRNGDSRASGARGTERSDVIKRPDTLPPASTNSSNSAAPHRTKEPASYARSSKIKQVISIDDVIVPDELCGSASPSPKRDRKTARPAPSNSQDSVPQAAPRPTGLSWKTPAPGRSRRIGLSHQSKHHGAIAPNASGSTSAPSSAAPTDNAGAEFFAARCVDTEDEPPLRRRSQGSEDPLRAARSDPSSSAESDTEGAKAVNALAAQFFDQAEAAVDCSSAPHDPRANTPGASPGSPPLLSPEWSLVPRPDPAGDAEGSVDMQVDETVLCEFCDEPMPLVRSVYLYELYYELRDISHPQPKRGNPQHRQLPWAQHAAYCTRHELERTVLPQGLEAGYPDEIDWAEIPRRLTTPWISRELASVIRQPSSSSGMRDVMRMIKERGPKRTTGLAWLSKETFAETGYYGILGQNLLAAHLTNLIEWGTLPAINLSSIQPFKKHDFVVYVLVPHAANLLIMQDRGYTPMEKGRERDWVAGLAAAEATRQASSAYGSCRFPDTGKEAKRTMKVYRKHLESTKEMCIALTADSTSLLRQKGQKPQHIIDLTTCDDLDDENDTMVHDENTTRIADETAALEDDDMLEENGDTSSTGDDRILVPASQEASQESADFDMDLDDDTAAAMLLAASKCEAEQAQTAPQAASAVDLESSSAKTSVTWEGKTAPTSSSQVFAKTPSFDEYWSMEDSSSFDWAEAAAKTDKASMALRGAVSAR